MSSPQEGRAGGSRAELAEMRGCLLFPYARSDDYVFELVAELDAIFAWEDAAAVDVH